MRHDISSLSASFPNASFILLTTSSRLAFSPSVWAVSIQLQKFVMDSDGKKFLRFTGIISDTGFFSLLLGTSS